MRKRKNFMNKRANFLEEKGLEIIIGVVCLGVLSFLAISIYSLFFNNQNLNQAKTLSNSILEKVKYLLEGSNQENYFSILLTNPNNWYIAGYSSDYKDKPSLCFSSNCICICKSKNLFSNQLTCEDKGGVCINVQELSNTFGPIKINSGKPSNLRFNLIKDNNNNKIKVEIKGDN